ncbi:hypothetical protein ABZV91_14425 [Nocardia sp. NPDC004568]|uniref:hypothetical protein n=1 Tax=Nocardia sp. NPDC004568 TaxID=3154551 RepID=UPI0033ACE70B
MLDIGAPFRLTHRPAGYLRFPFAGARTGDYFSQAFGHIGVIAGGVNLARAAGATA